jgi:hypothetical protein
MASQGSLASRLRRLPGLPSLARAFGLRPDEYGLPYFDHIISAYINTEYDAADPRARAIVDFIESVRRKRLQQPQSLALSDVFSVERAILRLQNLDSLRARAWELREQYRRVFGEDTFAVYERSAHDPSRATAEQLRTDLLQLLDAFHWRYTFGPIREQALEGVTRGLLGVMLLFSLPALAALGVDYWRWGRSNQTVSLIPLVLFAGATGAALSLQNRLQQVPTTGDSIINLFSLKHARVSLWLSPITGALFALLAYLLFISGLVQGELFPKIRIAQTTAQLATAPLHYDRSFGSYLYSMSPTDSLNFAKLLIFCFIAGFAERLIPDALDRLVVKNVNNLTSRVLTADSLKGMLTGVVATVAQDKAVAEAEETKKRKESEERAAQEKATAEQEATRKKVEIETRAAEAKTNVEDPEKEEIDKQAAADKAAAETEATQKKKEADLKAAASKAAAETEATQKKKAADDRALEVPMEQPLAQPTNPPLEPQKAPDEAGQTSPSPQKPKDP